MQNKLDNIQALRALAVMMVVMLHVRAIEIKYSILDTLLPDFLRICLSGVDLFFVISGFIMVTVTNHLTASTWQDSSRQAGRFLYLRFTRIYPLYWLISLAILVVFLNHPSFLNLPHYDTAYAIRSLLLLPQPSLPLLMVGWSLIHELYFYLVFALFLLVPRRYLACLLSAWFIIVWIGSRHVDPFDPEVNQFLRIAASPVTAEFIAGCYLALVMQAYTGRHYPRPLLAIATGCIILLATWNHFSFITATDIVGWTRVYLFTVPFCLLIYGAVALERNKRWLAPVWVVRVGDASYSIYLTHILLLSVCGRLWAMALFHGYLDNVLAIVVMIAVAIGGGYLCYTWLEKPLLRWSHSWVRKSSGP